MPLQLASARKHYRLSALIARNAVKEARKAAPRGVAAMSQVVAAHQVTQAVRSQAAIGEMLAEQSIDAATEALLNSLAFTTSVQMFTAMVDSAGPSGIDRLVESLVQDAGRSAESVASAARPRIYHVRQLTPPSCSRCAVLAGRVYRYSDGFKRHPNCDCVMVPTTVASSNAIDPLDLINRGLVTGLSKADRQAVADGADLNKVVNVRLAKGNLQEAGRVLARRGRLTPEGIYASTNTREEALAALEAAGYLL